MNRNLFDEYRERMSNVELSDEARDDLDRAILNKRAAVGQSGSAMMPEGRVGTRRVWRYAAVAACILAITLGGLFFAPNSGGIFEDQSDSFVLAAYASGASAEGSDNLKVALGGFARWGGWFTFDESSGWGDEGPYKNDFIHDTGMKKGYICSTYFDLTCKGTDIASLVYELDGQGVYFNFDPARDHSTPPNDFTRQRFTVGPNDLKNPNKGYIYLVSNVPATGDLAAPTAVLDDHLARVGKDVHAEFSTEEMDAYNQARDQIDTLIQVKAAEMIADTTLTITATFNDGSCESHEYHIVPVVDFAQRYRAFVDIGHRGDPSSFYCIEQLS